YAVALESHNHPSAIEPYGGAATGIGGILRDVVCMGAQPVAFIDPLFFAPLDYPPESIPRGTRHPKYLFRGVVAGIRDYGNRVGIPTLSGSVVFHPDYLTNCLVNVGCVGILPKKNLTRSRVKKAGDIYVMCGGRTGRDGIHGVTFASEDLHEDSEEEDRGAVQLGDPITKEPLNHACLECVEKGLLDGMKDFGGGGMSSVAGEMAYSGGFGAEIQLDKVPLKEEGLMPWEIWVSESQERMMLAVDPSKLDEVLAIMDKWDVEATIVGKAIEETRLRIFYQGHKVLDMDLEFYTGGPVYDRPYVLPEKMIIRGQWEEDGDYTTHLLRMLSSPNVCSRSWVIRQYDHQVRGSTVLAPLQGRLNNEGPGDAAVVQPILGNPRGLAFSSDVNPYLTELDPYWGSVLAVEEACRNLVAVGARPHSLADCLNFGNPERPDRMGILVESCRGLGDIARALGVPYVSGNVSLYNEGAKGPIPPTPTIMAVGLVEDVNKLVSSDLKENGNLLFMVGSPSSQMGGSLFLRQKGIEDNSIPQVDLEKVKGRMDALLRAIDRGLVRACHDVDEGGLAVALAEMCIGGDAGAKVEVETEMMPSIFIFNETPTRWIIEARAEDEEKLKEALGDTPLAKIGVVHADKNTGIGELSITVNGENLIKARLEDLRNSWENPIWDVMG
ncbi:MAG: phosphoribosylformylglycinamidine synthase subunit PurL, partial [Candidatus Thermoplasmatota archaeon]|nr:phosphoribosylformylglycinamidine synthase subunit PurL [Candidatus Thermoplasmatota archaeon]